MSKARVLVFLFIFAMLSLTRTARGDGMIVPIRPMPIILGDLYSVKYHRVYVDIHDQVATTTVEQAFINETAQPVEVQYIFPLPPNAQINKFSLIVGDQEISGKILGKDEARKIYEDIVRSQRDPGLLEYIGQGMFRTSVFPLPPHGERKSKLVYSELLKRDGDRVEYRYPLNTEKFSKKVLEEARVEFSLTSTAHLKNVYSPTHDVAPRWSGNNEVKGRWSAEGVRPDNDFRLFWTLSDEEVGATLFTYRPDPGDDGYFLFLASPKAEAANRKIVGKNVIVVLDHSGSMAGNKIQQAKGAARFITENLNSSDRFNIIFYDDNVDPLWDELRDYTSDNRREALAKIDSITDSGSTDIHGALTRAMGMIKDRSRPNFIIFLTDGLPTAGITNLSKIVEDVNKANTNNTRLFVFGVGYDVNAVLLDRLGTENHGLAEYVRPGENIEAAVSNFYSKIQNPALTDITLDFGGVRVRDTYPRAIPDLFRGGQLVVVGRYRDAGTRTITLTGAMGDKKQTFTYKLDFNNRTDREEFAFVSRLWAQKKIGWLIEQIRLKGENKEYVDEIVKLSTRYGIMTEYTSFLAREDVNIHDVAGNVAETHRNLKARTSVQTGAGGVNQAMQSGAMQTTNQAPGQAQFLNDEGRMVTMNTVKIIGSKTFYLKKGVWMDSEYREGMRIVELKQFDNPYFDLANKAPTQAQYMTFAPKESIIVVIDGVAYRIVAPK